MQTSFHSKRMVPQTIARHRTPRCVADWARGQLQRHPASGRSCLSMESLQSSVGNQFSMPKAPVHHGRSVAVPRTLLRTAGQFQHRRPHGRVLFLQLPSQALQRSRASTSRSTSIGPAANPVPQPFRRYNRRKLGCPVDCNYCRAGSRIMPIFDFRLPFCYPCRWHVTWRSSSTAKPLEPSPRRLSAPLAHPLPASERQKLRCVFCISLSVSNDDKTQLASH